MPFLITNLIFIAISVIMLLVLLFNSLFLPGILITIFILLVCNCDDISATDDDYVGDVVGNCDEC